jgi:4-aminobutyrate aminotransferase
MLQMKNNAEGDLNNSALREKWLNNLDLSTKEILRRDEKCFISQSMSTPCLDVIRSASGIFIEDTAGRRYMDFHGNSVHQVGYANPHVLRAVGEQLSALHFSPRRYTNEKAVELAEKLIGYMPGGDYKVLFTPGGASSISVALKLTRYATGRHKTISLWGSFHGANLDTISVGGESAFRASVGPLMAGCEHVMPYNSYRCVFGDCGPCGLKCLDYIEYVMECEGDIGAVLLETVRSTDVHAPPSEYFVGLRRLCDDHGALLILDEIPTALGRTGEMYAFSNRGIEPDILVLGKGLGGGVIPFSAVLARSELDVCRAVSIGHYTHEKNPLGAAAALAVIEFIESENILGHVRELSVCLAALLKDIETEHRLVGNVRVAGLLAAVELVRSRDTKEHADAEAEKVMYRCLENGLSFKVSQGNIITLSPPLVISESELKHAADILEKSIAEVSHETLY